METTITEALSEINLIKKKITEKEAFIKNLLFKMSHQNDPVGSPEAALAKEQQSIRDMRNRIVKIKSAISKANLENEIQIGDISRSIYDWLTWKREIYTGEIAHERDSLQRVLNIDSIEKSRPQVYEDDKGVKHLITYVRYLNVAETQSRIEKIEEIYGKLDGQLSLKNATIKIKLN